MRRARRYLIAAALVAFPVAMTSCVIPLGNGCNLLIAEPGAQVGVSCNF